MSKKKFKICVCRNPKCKVKRFMVEKGRFEDYCSAECRIEHKKDKKC